MPDHDVKQRNRVNTDPDTRRQWRQGGAAGGQTSRCTALMAAPILLICWDELATLGPA